MALDTGDNMSSSEIVDPGTVSVGRSFSQTCSLLSQFMKEKGRFGGIGLGLNRNLESKETGAAAAAGTMNLLPMIEKSADKNSTQPLYKHLQHVVDGEETRKNSVTDKEFFYLTPHIWCANSVTIFYAGQVIVFKDIPADKANEIMMLASKSGAAPAAFFPANTGRNPVESATNKPNLVPAIPQPHISSDLPIARKNSLARFLEKRKDRIIENAPYQAANRHAAPAKQAELREAWLGLA